MALCPGVAQGMPTLSNDTQCLRAECQRPRNEHVSWFHRPGATFGGATTQRFAYCPDNSGKSFEHRCALCEKPRAEHFTPDGRLGGDLCNLDPGGAARFTVPTYDDGTPEYLIHNAAPTNS